MLQNFAYYAQIMLHKFNTSFLLSYLNDKITTISSLSIPSTVWNLYHTINNYVHIDYILFIVYVALWKLNVVNTKLYNKILMIHSSKSHNPV